MPSTLSVLTKRSGSKSWIAAYIIARICSLIILHQKYGLSDNRANVLSIAIV
jgi:hypothetical protein